MPLSLDREAGYEPVLHGDGAHLAATDGHGLTTATLALVTRELEVTRRAFCSARASI